jgi:hypothetical protein
VFYKCCSYTESLLNVRDFVKYLDVATRMDPFYVSILFTYMYFVFIFKLEITDLGFGSTQLFLYLFKSNYNCAISLPKNCQISIKPHAYCLVGWRNSKNSLPPRFSTLLAPFQKRRIQSNET